ncbi:Imm1 family immunity protein [Streptomyces venezuelae]|uniref:Imm1 family immunity protein n=1 Tax=Streptomyces venezuelae TaxID=54571 RepID=UPI00278C203A|nr:Imm1 family immunity protein [Streptomyces venezuelae]
MIVYGRGKYARTGEEVDDLIHEIINTLAQRVVDPSGYETVPERAVVCIVEDDHPEKSTRWHADNCMYVSVDIESGYGALKWWGTQRAGSKVSSDVFKSVWTSMNPSPPDRDPLLIKDPGAGDCYPPEAAIPAAQVQEALEEFCHLRTGDRPECIKWQLLDQSY